MMRKSKEIYATRSFNSESMPFRELAGSWAVYCWPPQGQQRPYGGSYWECGILKALFSLNLMSQQALASTAEKYKWLILPVGVHLVSFTSPYLVIFIQHTVKYISEWRGHTNGSKVFQGHCHQYVNSGIYLAHGAQQSLNRVAVWGANELYSIIVNLDPGRWVHLLLVNKWGKFNGSLWGEPMFYSLARAENLAGH